METISQRRRALERAFPTWQPMTLDERLSWCADRHADRPLVLTDDQTLTYRQVDEDATELADGLAALGVRPGDRVGMVMANHPEFVPLKFAIARAGAVAIPFNFLYRAGELAYVLQQSGCNLLISMTGHGDLDYQAMLDEIAPGWAQGQQDALPALRKVVVLPTTSDARDGALDVEGLRAVGRAQSGAANGHGAQPDDVGDMLYTSGTTGSPKGVLVTHDAVQRTAYASALTRAFEDGRRILFSLPCYHMFGYVEGLLASMMVGGAIIPQTTFDPAWYFAGIEQHRATDILCVPTMTVALVEHPDRRTRDLGTLQALLSGAAPAPVWLWDRVQDELGVNEIVTGYGMTECGGAMTLTMPEDPVGHHSETVGRPKLAGVAGLPEAGGALCEYATVDPVSGEPLPGGREGELVSRGPTHMVGFWNKPEETAAAIRHGWVHSGDLGLVRDDGYLQLTGRSKELYKSGGELVMPKEVEELVSALEGISQAYAVGVPDDRWGEVGMLWIVPEPGTSVDTDAVLAHCRQHLARFKVPKFARVIAPDHLPTTPTGKVQKFQLVRIASEQLAGDSV